MSDTRKEIDLSVDIDAAPDKVWAMVSDLDRMGEWSPECTGVKWKSALTGPQVGAKFKGRNRSGKRSWSTDGKIVVADPEREVAWDISFLGFPVARWGYRIEPRGEGTSTVTEYWRERRNALLRWSVPGTVVTGVKDRVGANEASIRATLDQLKGAAEAKP
ncbi:MAG: SRPBCC family protein [Acidimicrobiia bacterium]